MAPSPDDNPFFGQGKRQVSRNLGARLAESVHVRRAARNRPPFPQRRGRQSGRNQRRRRRRQLRLADRRTWADHGSALPRPNPPLSDGLHLAAGPLHPRDLPWPKEYRGQYFFGDFNHGWIKIIDPAKPAAAKSFATGLRRSGRFALRPGRQSLCPAARCLGDRQVIPRRQRSLASHSVHGQINGHGKGKVQGRPPSTLERLRLEFRAERMKQMVQDARDRSLTFAATGPPDHAILQTR